MKKIIVSISLILIVGFTFAQKFNPAPTFLKGETKLNVVFEFDGFTLYGDTEENYIKDKVKDMSEKDKKEWTTEWKGKAREDCKFMFLKDVNAECDKQITLKENEKSAYTIHVKVIDINPGFFAGIVNKPAIIKTYIYFTKTGSKEVLSSSDMKVAAVFTIPVENQRIAMSFGETGEQLGKYLNKTLKKLNK